MKEKKEYLSPLRQEQMQRTREQILEALIRTIGQGVAGLSIPAVAREAGVSIPTVYRYFHSKQELISALGSYLMQKMGLSNLQPPRTLDELLDLTRQAFIQAEGLNDAIKAATVSELGSQVRKNAMPLRIRLLEQAIATELAPLNERDRVRLRNIVLILTSSAMIRAFQEYLDVSGEEAADTVIWAIRLLTRTAAWEAEDGSHE